MLIEQKPGFRIFESKIHECPNCVRTGSKESKGAQGQSPYHASHFPGKIEIQSYQETEGDHFYFESEDFNWPYDYKLRVLVLAPKCRSLGN